MNKNYTFKDSQTDWERINAIQDEDIDLSDIPEITASQMARATRRVAGKPAPKNKIWVHMQLDANVIAHFKKQAGEQHYQLMINEVLKASIANPPLPVGR